MDNVQDGALGSHRGLGVSTWHAYCLWILMSQNRFTRPSTPWAGRALSVPSITLRLEGLDVECERVSDSVVLTYLFVRLKLH
ncbi:hypothetical protein DPMN_070325 [Dreissena polymorpha]|uniref:Uncharacterized protein n=1 Tax=Dreissena polymorpha TaxID=45954 RepID=A0A9D3Z574_DREPO|nr:hypothetical protein DPMN_070325 [Dreissena polymorpha]